MGIKLPRAGKESEPAASYTLPAPPEEGAFCHKVTFYCSDEGINAERYWESAEVEFSIGSPIIMPDTLQKLHDNDCKAPTHRPGYDLRVVKSE